MTTPVAHRTAIARGSFSRPTRLSLDLGLLRAGLTFFDYGCGRGEDVDGLQLLGFDASGWDPHYRPSEKVKAADVVNIGYVVNVIADPDERRTALATAWAHAGKALVVAARLSAERRTLTLGRGYGDGYLTGNSTFQRFFDQSELRAWIDSTLDVESVAVAPGIFAVFRSESDANEFLLRNSRRRRVAVQLSRADQLYDSHRVEIDALIAFFSDRGRLPFPGESPQLEHDLRSNLGSVRRAWRIVEKVTPATDWSALTNARRSDLLVDLALLRLNRRPNFTALPIETQYDVKALVGSYKGATALADELLFSAGDLGLISNLANEVEVGKRLPTALYVHDSGLVHLPPAMRVYEGCARWLVGRVEAANIIKLATDQAKVSYLEYPDFDKDPHPSLDRATYVRLQGLVVDSRSYIESSNPPILHRKEQFVPLDYPNRSKFERLTQQEERFGLLDHDTHLIGNRVGWEGRLHDVGVRTVGHRVVRSVVG